MNESNEDSDQNYSEDMSEESDDSYVKTKRRKSNKTQEVVTKADSVEAMTRKPNINTKKCFDMKTKTYICPINECHKSCETITQFYRHLQSYLKTHSKTHINFKCHYNGCEYETHTKALFTEHLAIHSADKPLFRCDVIDCGKTLKSSFGYKLHSLRHQNKPTLKCGINGCNDMFLYSCQRRRHQTRVHNRAPLVPKKHKYGCDWPGCEWTGLHVNDHKRTHTGDKPFQCLWPECGKRFRMNIQLKAHMNIHNNVKPYACHWPGCQFRSASNANFHKHVQNIHKK
ncbi:unnamed protein product [Medioppia subpectinata]|uniref:C2H2-type domain-containing protein n=1 Tax=Medioppia subpectinata TaxID=1979941 RepID=A0A7R9KEJ9_9ACAR|nr:unnamed protein product [Medioppia subpectinata]CAG2101901.1 unnamed protein product [Medioppia subpectinata]